MSTDTNSVPNKHTGNHSRLPPPPTHHLRPPPQTQPSKPTAVLLLVGSLSPITHMHLRLLELARDTISSTGHHILGGYISPTADAYSKPGMLPAHHRLRMASLALADSPWVAVDPWEATHSRFVRTHEVVSRILNAVATAGWPNVHLFLVCGADLLHAMADHTKWPKDSVENLFRLARVVWAKRGDMDGTILSQGGALDKYRERTVEMHGFTWGVSSTAVRDSVRRGRSILYMTPKPVIDYIAALHLFLDDVHRGNEAPICDGIDDASGSRPQPTNRFSH